MRRLVLPDAGLREFGDVRAGGVLDGPLMPPSNFVITSGVRSSNCIVRQTDCVGRASTKPAVPVYNSRMSGESQAAEDQADRASRRARRHLLLAAILVLSGLVGVAAPARANDASPFESLIGRWVGDGRLGVRNGKTEQVKCRVTYLHQKSEDPLQQTIRCASAGGSVEVRSWVTHAAGILSGTWEELERKWKGEIAGKVTPRGFKVAVKGDNLTANMDIVVLGSRQIIEIQFIGSTLIGLTLILEKG